jgi:hypothetical protein
MRNDCSQDPNDDNSGKNKDRRDTPRFKIIHIGIDGFRIGLWFVQGLSTPYGSKDGIN